MLIHQHIRQQGTSLIEVTIVMTIIALVLTFGIPSFMEWIQNTQIRATAESIQSGLQIARAEAVRRNARVEFQLSNNIGSEGGTGWQIVSVAAPQETIQAKADSEGGSSRIIVTPTPNDATTITFEGTGRTPLGAGGNNADGTPFLSRIDIDSAGLDTSASRELRITIDGVGGQIRMCDPNVSTNNDPRKCS